MGTIHDDIAWVDHWLAQPDCGFKQLREEFEHLRSVNHAREYLLGVRKSLESVRDGRVLSHEEVRRRSEERIRRYRLDAAE